MEKYFPDARRSLISKGFLESEIAIYRSSFKSPRVDIWMMHFLLLGTNYVIFQLEIHLDSIFMCWILVVELVRDFLMGH